MQTKLVDHLAYRCKTPTACQFHTQKKENAHRIRLNVYKEATQHDCQCIEEFTE